MKIGVVILCRYNSSRLPGKILKTIKGQPILKHIVNRINEVPELECVVATSDESSDDKIAEFCTTEGINYFRGSLENVSQRFLKAAEAQEFTYAIRINGDNIFIDTKTLMEMIESAKSDEFDFLSNVKGRTFPFGMSIEILKTSFYQELQSKLDTSYYQEHVTIYLYENEAEGDRCYFINKQVPEAKGLKLAIDTPEDFKQASQIINHPSFNLKDYTLKDICSTLETISL